MTIGLRPNRFGFERGFVSSGGGEASLAVRHHVPLSGSRVAPRQLSKRTTFCFDLSNNIVLETDDENRSSQKDT